MSIKIQFEHVNNRDEQTRIESTVLGALRNPEGQWKVTVVGLRSGHAYIIVVVGPGARWGTCYQVEPEMLKRIKADLERLGTCTAHSILGQSLQQGPDILRTTPIG
jgi:hypothetical protein